MSGIFFCASSFRAISSGSVSFSSNGTSTGAFMLLPAVRPRSKSHTREDLPDLQRARAQDPRPLVFGHVGRGDPLSVGVPVRPVRRRVPRVHNAVRVAVLVRRESVRLAVCGRCCCIGVVEFAKGWIVVLASDERV
jgi:hypothetical protein